MAKLLLQCISNDKRFSAGDWLLTLDDEGGALTDCEGTTRATFARAEAEGRFVFPSFWESVKDLQVREDKGGFFSFVPDAQSVAQIKKYLHGALAAQGPVAIKALRTKGWLLVLAGVGITLVATGVMVASMAAAFGSQEGGRYYVTIGATVFGLIVLARGFAALSKASRANKALEEP